MSTVWEHLLAFISDNLDHEYRVPWNEKCSKTLSKVYSFHIHSSCRRRTTPCVALHCELAAAAPKLKWHFLAAASRQKAPFCPFTSNLCDTYVLYTVGSLKKLTAVIEETDSGFRVGQNSWCQHTSWWRHRSKWEINFTDISVAAARRKRLKSSNLVQFIFHLFRNICLFYLASGPGNRIRYR